MMRKFNTLGKNLFSPTISKSSKSAFKSYNKHAIASMGNMGTSGLVNARKTSNAFLNMGRRNRGRKF